MKTIYKDNISREDIKNELEEIKKYDKNIFDTPIIGVIDNDDILIVHNDNVLYFGSSGVEVRYSGLPGSHLMVGDIVKDISTHLYSGVVVCFEKHLDSYKKIISSFIEEIIGENKNIEYINIDYNKKSYSYKMYDQYFSFCGKVNKLSEFIPTLKSIDFNNVEDPTKSRSFAIAERGYQMT